jgi:hypothetical protein
MSSIPSSSTSNDIKAGLPQQGDSFIQIDTILYHGDPHTDIYLDTCKLTHTKGSILIDNKKLK